MEFFQRAGPSPKRLGILPGTFNPVTVAHLALAQSALAAVDEVVFVLPHTFPHKQYEGAPFEARIEMLRDALAGMPFSIAGTQGGLFLEIAREARAAYGDVEIALLCGRDAAERIVGWDYDRPDTRIAMFREFQLLVAARQGEYQPPADLGHAIRRLDVSGDFDPVSATEVRQRIRRGEPWEHLVPPAVRQRALQIYGGFVDERDATAASSPGSLPGSSPDC